MAFEILGVTARVPASVLREKHPVGVVSPTRAGPPDIVRTESAWKATVSNSSADVLHEPAHLTHDRRVRNPMFRHGGAGYAPPSGGMGYPAPIGRLNVR